MSGRIMLRVFLKNRITPGTQAIDMSCGHAGEKGFLKTASLVPYIPALTHHIEMAVKLTANVENIRR